MSIFDKIKAKARKRFGKNDVIEQKEGFACAFIPDHVLKATLAMYSMLNPHIYTGTHKEHEGITVMIDEANDHILLIALATDTEGSEHAVAFCPQAAGIIIRSAVKAPSKEEQMRAHDVLTSGLQLAGFAQVVGPERAKDKMPDGVFMKIVRMEPGED